MYPNPKDQRDGNARIRVAVRKRPLNHREPSEDVLVVWSYKEAPLNNESSPFYAAF